MCRRKALANNEDSLAAIAASLAGIAESLAAMAPDSKASPRGFGEADA
jgi:hypothetical protein